ncbi:MAG: hypothetical protein ACRELD_05300 [Longimicrobiales bacterium]
MTRFDLAARGVLALFLVGWAVAFQATAAGETTFRFGGRLTMSPFSPAAPPEAAVLVDVVNRELIGDDFEVYRGESGAVRVAVVEPGDTLELGDTVPPGVQLEFVAPRDTLDPAPASRGEPPAQPGAWRILLRRGRAVRHLADFNILTMVPASTLQGGRIGDYLIGRWPARGERPARFRTAHYDAPSGLIRVDEDEIDLQVSEHFRLGDFLTKGQAGVWPKYVVMSPRLLDKLELTIQQLERDGHAVGRVGVISGFRTPQYNAHGGSTAGRGSFSRHMYGDAMDWFVDNDGNGSMDDLNGDGAVDVEDARVIVGAAERVEARYPHLVGGIGLYRPSPGAHAGFVHIDTRGYRARW